MTHLVNPFVDGGEPRPFTTHTTPPLSSWVLRPPPSTAPLSQRRSNANGPPPVPSSSLHVFPSLQSLPPLHFQAPPRLVAHRFLPALRDVRVSGDDFEGGVSEERVHELLKTTINAAYTQWRTEGETQRQQWEAEQQRKMGQCVAQMHETMQSLQREVESLKRHVEQLSRETGEAKEQLQGVGREQSRLAEEVAGMKADSNQRMETILQSSEFTALSPGCKAWTTFSPSSATKAEAAADGGVKEELVAAAPCTTAQSTPSVASPSPSRGLSQSSSSSSPLTPTPSSLMTGFGHLKGTVFGERVQSVIADFKADPQWSTDGRILQLVAQMSQIGTDKQKSFGVTTAPMKPQTTKKKASEEGSSTAQSISPAPVQQVRRNPRRGMKRKTEEEDEREVIDVGSPVDSAEPSRKGTTANWTGEGRQGEGKAVKKVGGVFDFDSPASTP